MIRISLIQTLMQRLILAACVVSFLFGCTNSSPTAPAERRFALQGEVISVNAPEKLLAVKHGDIPGFMSAMSMSYSVAAVGELENLKPGDNIKADLVVVNGLARLEKIAKVEPLVSAPASTPSSGAAQPPHH